MALACRCLQRREGARVSDSALQKFASLWNGDWAGPLVHDCDGCCAEGETAKNMFGAALEIDLMQSRPERAWDGGMGLDACCVPVQASRGGRCALRR
eukprot:2872666-Pyramimonas_sp.AAC.1